MKTKKTKTKSQKSYGIMGYLHAYRYLEFHSANTKNKKTKEQLMKVLNDFKYCIQQTERFEKASEAVKDLKKAFSEQLENIEDSYF